MKGKVKFFDVTKGFGFIIGEDGNQYFVHSSALESGASLKEGDEVSFEIEEGNKGPRAAKVSKN